ncbi:MAG: hypothetical protein ACM3ZE_22135 [Myxococcales bacterium]
MDVNTLPADERRTRVWEALAEHFLDAETCQEIPWTAFTGSLASSFGESSVFLESREGTEPFEPRVH